MFLLLIFAPDIYLKCGFVSSFSHYSKLKSAVDISLVSSIVIQDLVLIVNMKVFLVIFLIMLQSSVTFRICLAVTDLASYECFHLCHHDDHGMGELCDGDCFLIDQAHTLHSFDFKSYPYDGFDFAFLPVDALLIIDHLPILQDFSLFHLKDDIPCSPDVLFMERPPQVA